MANFPPLATDFKAQFTREFVYGTGLDTVRDGDIQRALNEAGLDFPGFFDTTTVVGSSTQGGIAYMYLAAHFLVKNIQAAGGLNASSGVKNHGGGVVESKGVGGVSLAYALVDLARQSPLLSPLLETDFGKRYLQMIYPYLIGNVALVSGRSPWTV